MESGILSHLENLGISVWKIGIHPKWANTRIQTNSLEKIESKIKGFKNKVNDEEDWRGCFRSVFDGFGFVIKGTVNLLHQGLL